MVQQQTSSSLCYFVIFVPGLSPKMSFMMEKKTMTKIMKACLKFNTKMAHLWSTAANPILLYLQ